MFPWTCILTSHSTYWILPWSFCKLYWHTVIALYINGYIISEANIMNCELCERQECYLEDRVGCTCALDLYCSTWYIVNTIQPLSHKRRSYCEGMQMFLWKEKNKIPLKPLRDCTALTYICLKIQQVKLKNLKMKSLFKLVKCCREALGGWMNVWNFFPIFVASSELIAEGHVGSLWTTYITAQICQNQQTVMISFSSNSLGLYTW